MHKFHIDEFKNQRKDPTKTFIGGLIIGGLLGGLIVGLTVYVLMSNWIIATFG